MTAPTHQSTTVTDFGADATTHNVNMPATVTSGDLLLAIAAFDATTTTITMPGGWTLLHSVTIASDSVYGVYAKIAAGSEGGTTVDFATSNSQRGSVHVLRVTGWCNSLDGLRLLAFDYQSSVGSTPGVAIAAANLDILWVYAEVKSLSNAWGTAPSGYSNEAKTGTGENTTLSASVASASKGATAFAENTPAGWLQSAAIIPTLLIAIPTTMP